MGSGVHQGDNLCCRLGKADPQGLFKLASQLKAGINSAWQQGFMMF